MEKKVTKAKRLEEAEKKLDRSITEEFLPGYEQAEIVGKGSFGAVWTFKDTSHTNDGRDDKSKRKLSTPICKHPTKSFAVPQTNRVVASSSVSATVSGAVSAAAAASADGTIDVKMRQQRRLASIAQKLDQAKSPKTNMRFILKLSSFVNDREGRFLDSYLREVYFLKTLRGTGLVPALLQDRRKVEKNIGIQMMERFDGNLKALGVKQAELLGMKNGKNQVAFTLPQLESMVMLAKSLDTKGIVHGDLKLSNLLFRRIIDEQKKDVPDSPRSGLDIPAYETRVCDFGFSGYRRPQKDCPLHPLHPLNGFTGNFGSPTKRNRQTIRDPNDPGKTKHSFVLQEPIPDTLLPHFNRCQLYICLTETVRLHSFDPKEGASSLRAYRSNEQLNQLRTMFGMTDPILLDLYQYCPKLQRCIPEKIRKCKRDLDKRKEKVERQLRKLEKKNSVPTHPLTKRTHTTEEAKAWIDEQQHTRTQNKEKYKH